MTPRDMRSRTRINICFSCNLFLSCLADSCGLMPFSIFCISIRFQCSVCDVLCIIFGFAFPNRNTHTRTRTAFECRLELGWRTLNEWRALKSHYLFLIINFDDKILSPEVSYSATPIALNRKMRDDNISKCAQAHCPNQTNIINTSNTSSNNNNNNCFSYSGSGSS